MSSKPLLRLTRWLPGNMLLNVLCMQLSDGCQQQHAAGGAANGVKYGQAINDRTV